MLRAKIELPAKIPLFTKFPLTILVIFNACFIVHVMNRYFNYYLIELTILNF